MGREGLALVQGTLDLMILGILARGPAHGYGIAEQVREATTGELSIQDGALYQALHRLEQQGLVDAEWGASENNRRARFYSLTPKGRRRVREQAAEWHRYARALASLLKGV
ncbi:MAG TPA: PadR family transcriptional regulator [Vicinamibacterales bacterium]|jgi:PadR family transcriptional regulator PadR|nr:PadR family transcriptional regulator [Vicinamibacterales bacterium]